jgi:hypothetical protein
MKHEFKIIPKEEVLANRSNAYEFIDFDKQETLENNLNNAKNYFSNNNFEFFTKEQLNVIGKTMMQYAEQFKNK